MTIYFVSYQFKGPLGDGFGNSQAVLYHPVRSHHDVTLMAQQVQQANPKLGNVVILSWQPFEKEEA